MGRPVDANGAACGCEWLDAGVCQQAHSWPRQVPGCSAGWMVRGDHPPGAQPGPCSLRIRWVGGVGGPGRNCPGWHHVHHPRTARLPPRQPRTPPAPPPRRPPGRIRPRFSPRTALFAKRGPKPARPGRLAPTARARGMLRREAWTSLSLWRHRTQPLIARQRRATGALFSEDPLRWRAGSQLSGLAPRPPSAPPTSHQAQAETAGRPPRQPRAEFVHASRPRTPRLAKRGPKPARPGRLASTARARGMLRREAWTSFSP
jgi:hypothetical protein